MTAKPEDNVRVSDDSRRCVCLKAYVTEQEYRQIVDLSSRCGLSVSELARRVLLGQRVDSKVDKKAFLEMLGVKADLGRLGGLLKLWLSDKSKVVGCTSEVRKVLHQIETRQKDLKPLIEELEKSVRNRKY